MTFCNAPDKEPNGWVSVKDRLPTKEDADERGGVYILIYGRVYNAHHSTVPQVLKDTTHWHPKQKQPAPPEGDNETIRP